MGGGDGRDNLRVTRLGSHHDLLDDHHDLIMCADGHDLESVLSLCHYQFCFHFDKVQVTCLRIPSCCSDGSREIVWYDHFMVDLPPYEKIDLFGKSA